MYIDNLPNELKDIIWDYINYKKYYKNKYKEIISDINEISKIFLNSDYIPARIAYECWGNGWKKINYMYI